MAKLIIHKNVSIKAPIAGKDLAGIKSSRGGK
jgi:hypothetical protein